MITCRLTVIQRMFYLTDVMHIRSNCNRRTTNPLIQKGGTGERKNPQITIKLGPVRALLRTAGTRVALLRMSFTSLLYTEHALCCGHKSTSANEPAAIIASTLYLSVLLSRIKVHCIPSVATRLMSNLRTICYCIE